MNELLIIKTILLVVPHQNKSKILNIKILNEKCSIPIYCSLELIRLIYRICKLFIPRIENILFVNSAFLAANSEKIVLLFFLIRSMLWPYGCPLFFLVGWGSIHFSNQ